MTRSQEGRKKAAEFLLENTKNPDVIKRAKEVLQEIEQCQNYNKGGK